ncbi:MAG: TIGR03668 family PPOX class F420-dependent oxidoreductase [Rubrobacter sp.]|nr:TIGR03668 family PPOX class F420-dependent oxidoreductase [Rubrobacter sp.]
MSGSSANLLEPDAAAFVTRRRVARLATADSSGEPHAIPVCFAAPPGLDALYIPLDEKPKSGDVRRLKRVRNILENPRAALIADRYAEDWSLLAFVLLRGAAELVEPGSDEHAAAVRLLRGKYRQYENMRIEDNPAIALRPERAASWGALSETDEPEDSLLDALHGRRSVRRYLDKPVPRADIERVLEAARWAPSPHSRQPWRFAVITTGETKSRLADEMGQSWYENLLMDGQPEEVVKRRLEGSRGRLLDAPALIALCLYTADLDEYPDPERQYHETQMAVQSLGAAAQSMMLAAYSAGLDTGWMCAPLFAPEEVRRALGLGDYLLPQALITLGYADGDPPRRRTRLPLDELVVYRG